MNRGCFPVYRCGMLNSLLDPVRRQSSGIKRGTPAFHQQLHRQIKTHTRLVRHKNNWPISSFGAGGGALGNWSEVTRCQERAVSLFAGRYVGLNGLKGGSKCSLSQSSQLHRSAQRISDVKLKVLTPFVNYF